LRPIATERGGGGGGSAVGSQTLGALERGHRPDTKVGLDGRRARRQYQGQSATKHGGGGGGGGVETEEEVVR
jgi:hypothetical protein